MSKRKAEKAERAVVYIDPGLHKKLKVIAAERGVTMQVLIDDSVRKTYRLLRTENGAADV